MTQFIQKYDKNNICMDTYQSNISVEHFPESSVLDLSCLNG